MKGHKSAAFLGFALFAGSVSLLVAAGCGGNEHPEPPGWTPIVTSFSPTSGTGCPQTITFVGTNLLPPAGIPGPIVMDGTDVGNGTITMQYQSNGSTSTQTIFTVPCPIPPGKYKVRYGGGLVFEGIYTQS